MRTFLTQKPSRIEVATRTAEALGFQCLKRDVDEQRLADDFEDAAYHAEHHNFDLNSVAKFALSSLPQEHGVRAILSGEGADEHFGGYSYFAPDFLREADDRMPDSVLTTDPGFRKELQLLAISEIKHIIKPQGVRLYCGPNDSEADLEEEMTPGALLSWFPRGKTFADWVQADDIDMRMPQLRSFTTDERAQMQQWHPLHKAMFQWTKTMLPNIILTCLGDRSEMGHSIEGRPPFLDHRLAEFVNSLPASVKMRYVAPNQGSDAAGQASDYWWKGAGSALQSVMEKWILREATRPFVTEEVYRRRKIMFLVPVRWKKDGALHMRLKSILAKEAVENLGFVRWSCIQDALARGFGDAADGASFRTLLYAASWVTLSKRFGVKKAVEPQGIRRSTM